MQHRSSLGCTQVITNKSDMFNPLGYEPHERNYYKSTHIIQSESPHNQLLTAIVWVQKIESNHVIAQNAAQVITCEQTGHHNKIRQI